MFRCSSFENREQDPFSARGIFETGEIPFTYNSRNIRVGFADELNVVASGRAPDQVEDLRLFIGRVDVTLLAVMGEQETELLSWLIGIGPVYRRNYRLTKQ